MRGEMDRHGAPVAGIPVNNREIRAAFSGRYIGYRFSRPDGYVV